MTPAWFPRPLKQVVVLLFTVFRHSLYSNKKLIRVLKKVIWEQTGNPDFTLADLNERIGPGKALIITVVNITERRTHFLKSDSPADGRWKLWEAILASSSNAPSLFCADTIRSQSLDILEDPGSNAIDFRRFQFELKEDIAAVTYQDDATYAYMKQLGDELGKRIAKKQFASERNPQFDPEGLYALRSKYRAAKYTEKHQKLQNLLIR